MKSYFISQSAPNIRRKRQKMETDPDSPTSHLVQVASRVFNNRDVKEEKSEDKKVRRQAHPLAVVLYVNQSARESGLTAHRDS